MPVNTTIILNGGKRELSGKIQRPPWRQHVRDLLPGFGFLTYRCAESLFSILRLLWVHKEWNLWTY